MMKIDHLLMLSISKAGKGGNAFKVVWIAFQRHACLQLRAMLSLAPLCPLFLLLKCRSIFYLTELLSRLWEAGHFLRMQPRG